MCVRVHIYIVTTFTTDHCTSILCVGWERGLRAWAARAWAASVGRERGPRAWAASVGCERWLRAWAASVGRERGLDRRAFSL